MTRLFACQNAIQLVTGASAFQERRRASGDAEDGENILFVHDLPAALNRNEGFIELIRVMARMLMPWTRVIHPSPESLTLLLAADQDAAVASLKKMLHLSKADEIYLMRPWSPMDKLLLKTYSEAQKICYGDASGTLIPIEYYRPPPKKPSPIRQFFIRVRSASAPARHEYLDFNEFWFLLDDAQGDKPPKTWNSIQRNTVLQQLEKLIPLAAPLLDDDLLENAECDPVRILLTSALSETNQISRENEIRAYGQLMKSIGHGLGRRLIVKPHPRDSQDKVQALRDHLNSLGYVRVHLLDSPESYYLPAEILLLALTHLVSNFKDHGRLTTVSSACLAAAQFLGLPCDIGFGEAIVRESFFPQSIAARLEYEQDLIKAQRRIIQQAR